MQGFFRNLLSRQNMSASVDCPSSPTSESSTLLDENSIKYEQHDGNWADVPLEKERRKGSQWARTSHVWLVVHCSLMFIYTGIFIAVITYITMNQAQTGSLRISPASEAVEFREQYFDIKPKIDSSWIGEPSTKLDENWHSLLQNTNIRITKDEFDRLDRKGIPLPDGGYLGALNVYHELHCVKRLHQYMYPDYYFPNLSKHERRLNFLHSQHCLDIIRQSIMCHADTSLITMRWGQSGAIPLANWTYPHQCVNWEKLDSWAGNRAVDVFARNYLVHPRFGPSYPKGFNPTIGVVTED
ncbi:hypothetical protein BKA63DRAFT_565888 [Paraphoma chrysanthemicola]|nr:hypothetical protein BKA63DRAFT_565888 [Paraphoma chrysanthemicola]